MVLRRGWKRNRRQHNGTKHFEYERVSVDSDGSSLSSISTLPESLVQQTYNDNSSFIRSRVRLILFLIVVEMFSLSIYFLHSKSSLRCSPQRNICLDMKSSKFSPDIGKLKIDYFFSVI